MQIYGILNSNKDISRPGFTSIDYDVNELSLKYHMTALISGVITTQNTKYEQIIFLVRCNISSDSLHYLLEQNKLRIGRHLVLTNAFLNIILCIS